MTLAPAGFGSRSREESMEQEREGGSLRRRVLALAEIQMEGAGRAVWPFTSRGSSRGRSPTKRR